MEKKEKKALNLRASLIILLALIVLGEGVFLLTHRKGGSPAENDSDAASGAPADGQESASGDSQPSAEASSAPDAAAESGNEKKSSGTDPKASDKQDTSGNSGSQTPAPTPPVEIPPENKGKAYAGVVGALSNYIKSPSAATLAYVLGGEFAGDQMQRFLPALFTMGGVGEEMLRTELTADLDIPEGTTSLTIAGEQALSKEELQSANQKLQDTKLSFSSIGDLADQVKNFSDSDWEEFGAQLNLTGPQAKELFTELTGSANSIASLLTDAKVSEGYQVTLKANTGASTVTNVYCINGKWVTSAFFDMQFS